METIDIKTMIGSWPKRRVDVGTEDLLANMRQCGISSSLVVTSSAILYDDDEGNEKTWQACVGHSEMIPTATLHPYNYLSCEHKVAALKERGFRVFRFCNKYQGWSLGLYCFTRLLRDLHDVAMPCIVDAMGMDDAWRLAKLADEYDVDIICTGLSYTFEAEVIAVAKDYRHIYFDAGRLTGPDAIELFCKHVGADRLVYGSEYPFDATLPSLYLLQTASITEAERQYIAAGNIKELLRL